MMKMCLSVGSAMLCAGLACGQTIVPGITVFSSSTNATASASSSPSQSNNTAFSGTATATASTGSGATFGSIGAGSGGYSHWDFGRLANGSINYSIGVGMQGSVNQIGSSWLPGGAGGTAEVTFRLASAQAVRLFGLFGDSASGGGWLRIIDVQINASSGGNAVGWSGIGPLIAAGSIDAVWPAGTYSLFTRVVASNNAPSLGVSGGTGNALAAGGVTVEFLNVVPAPGVGALAAMGGLWAMRRRRAQA